MEEVYTQWKESLKPKQRKRAYRHFDRTLDIDNVRDFEQVVTTLKNISTHQFLPLVKFIKKDIRYRKDKDKNPIRTIKERPIMYASHLDAHIYSFYAYQWGKKYEVFVREKGIETNTIAYRSRKATKEEDNLQGKNNIFFAHEIFDHIKSNGECAVIIADISKFFDTLNHRILKENISMILGNKLSGDEYKVLRSLTAFRYVLNDSHHRRKFSTYAKFILEVSKKVRHNKYPLVKAIYELGRNGTIKENKTPIGIPQGSALSGLLANIYMSLFDYEFVKKFPHTLYRRYSDDIAIVCAIPEKEAVFSSLCESIKLHALKINPAKAFIATFKRLCDGSVVCVEVKTGNGEVLGRKFIDYLGFEFNGSNVQVRGKTLQNAYRKAHKKVQKFLDRQTYKNPRKQPSAIGLIKKRKGGIYIKNAGEVMKNIGRGISSQQRKFFKYIRRKKAPSGNISN